MLSNVVFAFPGNGDLSGTNVSDLVEHVPGMRRHLSEVFAVVQDSTKLDLGSMLAGSGARTDEDARRLAGSVPRNLAIFALSWSYGKLLLEAGVEPLALVGYSLGEITAAALSGIWRLEDAVAFVAHRAGFFAESGPGSMLAVHARADEMFDRLSGKPVDVAIEVTRNLTVIAGSVAAVAEEAAALSADGYEHFALRVDYAAHSSMLDGYVDEVERFAALRTLHASTLPILNGQTGRFDDGMMKTPEYWGRHLRQTRKFSAMLDTIDQRGASLIVELGPPSFSSLLARSSDQTPVVLQTMGSGQSSNVVTLLDLFARLQDHGHRLSLGALVSRRPPSAGRDIVARTGEPYVASASARHESARHESAVAKPENRGFDTATVLGILQSTLPAKLRDDQHFFEAGGNSLLAMEALTRIENELGTRVRLREFLRNPTAQAIATLLRESSTPPVLASTVDPGPSGCVADPLPDGELPLLSLQFFSGDVEAESTDRYRLVLDAARAADRVGLHALWFPERHFNRFGGLYPSAALLAASVATITETIGLRGGSVVAPLSHPVRIAEEWAMVDNLSGGRAGISFGSGFVPRDFILAPGKFDVRKAVMFDAITAIRSMWKGVPYSGVGGTGLATSVDVLPRPLQHDIPVWLSTTRDVATFVEAGELGFGVLTALLRLTTDELAERITAYREARRRAGHVGPGTVTVMIHTFVGDSADDVQQSSSAPLRTYIRAHMEHTRELLSTKTLSSADEEELLDHAQARYLSTAGLFGTESECRSRLVALRSLGVDEVACLMDFGMSRTAVLSSIERLGRLAKVVVG